MYRKLHDKMALEGRMYRAGHVGGRAAKLARLLNERVMVPDFPLDMKFSRQNARERIT